MLLETLDIKKNDILIYSQNFFDLENNFKIIYKDDPSKAPYNITYGEVCGFINEFAPKNLIVYRLLTNIPDFEIFLSKYGFFITINGVTELIYFDPVFAVKELEDYSAKLGYDLRFRIQQVGLTTLNRHGNLPNYAEIYNVDMQAVEAKNQNDKVFADALFSVEQEVKKVEPVPPVLRKSTEKNTVLNPELQHKKTPERKISPVKEEQVHTAKSITPKESPATKQPAAPKQTAAPKQHAVPKQTAVTKQHAVPKQTTALNQPAVSRQPVQENYQSKLKVKTPEARVKSTVTEIRFIEHDLSEDKDFDYRQIMKINQKNGSVDNKTKVTEKYTVENKTNIAPVPKTHSPFGKFLQNKQISGDSNEHISLGDIPGDKITGIFKSPSSLRNLAEGKENPKVVLKLDRS
jgi:hypothetical protein